MNWCRAKGTSSGCDAHQAMMRSNLRVSSAMAPISISSVSMISGSRIATPAWHTAEPLYEAVAQALGILHRGHLGRGDRRGRDGVEGARQAPRRRAPGEDEGLPPLAGVADRKSV